MTEPKTLYAAYADLIETVLNDLVADGVLPADTSFANVTLEPPRDAAHGDLSTNAAMVLAKGAGMNPRALAEVITAKLAAYPAIRTSLEPVFASLNADVLRGLNAKIAIEGQDAKQVAAAYLAEKGFVKK